MMNRDILIVTPTLGRSAYLDQTIESVRIFGKGCTHCLVAPFAVVPALRAKYPMLEIYAEDPACGQGIYGAISTVVAKSQADWFTWINDDDYLEAGFLSVLNYARTRPDLDVIYGRVRMVSVSGGFLLDAPVAKWHLLAKLCAKVGQVPFTQQGAVFRVKKFNQIGGLKVGYRLVADTDLLFRLFNAGAKSIFVPKYVASYRLSPNQLSSDFGRQNAEHADMVEDLPWVGKGFRKLMIRAVFVLGNVSSYCRRVSRHGFVSVRTIMNRSYV